MIITYRDIIEKNKYKSLKDLYKYCYFNNKKLTIKRNKYIIKIEEI